MPPWSFARIDRRLQTCEKPHGVTTATSTTTDRGQFQILSSSW